jgi:hypothetical protein
MVACENASRRARSLVLVVTVVALAVAAPRTARADEGEDVPGAEAPVARPEPDPFRTKPGYAQLFVTSFLGDGVRFNNPYRLATPLGSDAESLSRTAPYIDVGIAATFGHPLGLQHGAALRTSVAVHGVGQVVMAPSYLAWRRWRSLALYGRAGVPIVVTPDVTWGLEAGLGATWFFLGGFGIAAELVGDVFYGAGTVERSAATYPVLSGQLGFVVAYEVLP